MHPLVPLLQLIHTLDRVEGRKKLQKTVHILKELGAPFRERFEYSFYGMYSPELKGEVDTLENEKLLKESPVEGIHPTFAIESTDELRALLKQYDLDQPPAWAETAKHLNKLTPQQLEGVSTILYLRRTGPPEEYVRSQLLSLKPHLKNIADYCFAEADKLPRFESAAA